jgi:phosphoribosylanthranilate isomerase
VPVDAKICGLTRPADAALAAAHGAWRLGVIFAGGPRLLTTAQARAVVDAASGVPVLGVFGPQPLRTILQTVSASGVRGVQLHGEHPGHIAGELRATGLEVWRVVPLVAGMDLAAVLGGAAEDADTLLVEAGREGGSGGQGIVIPHDLARSARLAAPAVRFALAGGLMPESVGEAIRVVGPDVVDVSSGVESSPGVKDSGRLVRFLENVRAARPPS